MNNFHYERNLKVKVHNMLKNMILISLWKWLWFVFQI